MKTLYQQQQSFADRVKLCLLTTIFCIVQYDQQIQQAQQTCLTARHSCVKAKDRHKSSLQLLCILLWLFLPLLFWLCFVYYLGRTSPQRALAPGRHVRGEARAHPSDASPSSGGRKQVFSLFTSTLVRLPMCVQSRCHLPWSQWVVVYTCTLSGTTMNKCSNCACC